MDWLNFGLIFVGGISLCFAIFIWLINKKNRINIYFGISLAAVSFWVASEGIMLLVRDEQYVRLFGVMTYFFGLIVPFSFLFFSFYFPFEARHFKKNLKIIFWILLLAGLVVCIIPDLLVRQGVVGTNGVNNDMRVNPLGFWFYAVLFFLFFVWSFYNLITKYINAQGYTKIQIRPILLGSLFLFVFASIFDLIIPYFEGEIFGWVGPYATIIMLVAISYLLFFSGKKIYLE